jgi:epsilon-lactone hydrolase
MHPFLAGLWNFSQAVTVVTLRRARRGPGRPSWSWVYEAGVDFLRRQARTVTAMSDIDRQRAYADGLWLPSLAQVMIQASRCTPGGVPARCLRPRFQSRGGALLYLHGGAYTFFVRTHDRLILPVCLSAGCPTYVVEYRLAPEYPFPTALEDSLQAYRGLIEAGVDPNRLVVGGDSAGGGLALALLHRIREEGLPLPRLALLISPWIDLACSGESMDTNGHVDWINRRVSLQMAEHYLPGGDFRHPHASPLFADLHGLPPLYIQAGECEVLYDQIVDLTQRARAQGVRVDLETWPDMCHEFQAFDRFIPQSRTALRRMGEVMRAAIEAKEKP